VAGLVVTRSILAPVSLALLVLALPCTSQVPSNAASPREDPELVLKEVRARIRQGLLAAAEQRLADIPPDAPAGTLASAALLAGNVDFEQGDFAQADARYRAAAELFRRDGDRGESPGSGWRIAEANRELALAQLARQSLLDRRAGWLRAVTAGTAGIAALLVWAASRALSRKSGV
jgi:hypothetical protein